MTLTHTPTDRPTDHPTDSGVSALTTSTVPSSAMPAAIRAGALAALGTWAVVVLPALVGWVAAPESSLGWFSAVSVASAIWFLGHGQVVGGGALTVSMTPVLLLLVFVLVTSRWVRSVVAAQRARVGTAASSRVVQFGVLPGFLLGYGFVAGVVALLTLGGPLRPGFAAVGGTLLVPVSAMAWVLLRPHDEDSPAFVRSWFRRGPTWLPYAWRVGWRGAVLLLAVGLGVVLLRLLVSWGAVAQVQGEYGVNLVAGLVIVVAQLFVLGNAATWALAFVAGPGFQVAVDGVVSPAAAHPGLMPLVPVLGALPDDADYPAALWVVVLVPVLVGVVVGRWVDAQVEFFGLARARLLAVTTAALVAVLPVVALTALGRGAIGVERLASVGPSVLPFGLALGGEVLLGALAHAGWAVWRERRVAPAADAA